MRRHVNRALALALILSGLYALLHWRLQASTGLLETRTDAGARWTGAWYVPRTALYDLAFSIDGPLTWTIDGDVAHRAPAGDRGGVRTVLLTAGFHPIAIDLLRPNPGGELPALAAAAGADARALDTESLLPEMPRHPQWRAMWRTLRTAFGIVIVAALAVAAWIGVTSAWRAAATRVVSRTGPARVARLRTIAWAALVVLVASYAALLRLEAITSKYGPVESPSWLRSAQSFTGLRSERITWDPEPSYPHRDGPPTRYFGDPYNYLRFGREMTNFYAAHWREPGYPFVTKVFLWLLNNQDVAVSFGSAFFSVLVVLATYRLGAYAFSRWVGLAAAFAMAIDYDVITWSALGGRDDTFTFTVLMFAHAALRYTREPSTTRAIWLGAWAGAACLVRITSPTFIVPVLLWLLVASKFPWKARLMQFAFAAATMTVIVAPYIINCWRVYGKPLYAIDAPATVYETAEGQTAKPGAATYVGAKLTSRPFQTVDTVAVGLTSYPFDNKWAGLDRWVPSLGQSLSTLALVGLLFFATTPTGRLLLLVLVSALLPYSITWKLSGEWRLTEVAYPFYLIAAAFAVHQALTWISVARVRAIVAMHRRQLARLALWWIVLLGAVGTGACAINRSLPVATVREALAAHEDVTIMAGDRDGGFFVGDWSAPRGRDNVKIRVAQGPHPVVRIPLVSPAEFDMTIRLDPFPRPTTDTPDRLPGIRLFLNGTLIGRADLKWNPSRVGGYDVHIPRSATRAGLNDLEFVIDPATILTADGRPITAGVGEGGTFGLWYVRVRPQPAQ